MPAIAVKLILIIYKFYYSKNIITLKLLILGEI